jgi:Putative addiction module component
MIKAEILEALPKLNAEERREIRAKLNELDSETWFDNGELSEQEKAIIEARLDEYDRNPEVGCSWEEVKLAFWPDCIPNELPPENPPGGRGGCGGSGSMVQRAAARLG